MPRDKMRYNDLPREVAQVVPSDCALAPDGCAGASYFEMLPLLLPGQRPFLVSRRVYAKIMRSATSTLAMLLGASGRRVLVSDHDGADL